VVSISVLSLFGCVVIVFCCFFFFQAEDGIRDDLVTGVQTCALPIWFGVNWTSTDCLPILPWPVKLMEPLKPPMGTTSNVPLTERSEERRVGKECRSRWSRER